MNVALQEKNVYEDFEPLQDTLFFKVGVHGLISFHGRNYNIKKRMSTDERNRLMTDSNTFYRVSSDCYVNLTKITTMEDDYLFFGDQSATAKRVPCSKRKQTIVKHMIAERSRRK